MQISGLSLFVQTSMAQPKLIVGGPLVGNQTSSIQAISVPFGQGGSIQAFLVMTGQSNIAFFPNIKMVMPSTRLVPSVQLSHVQVLNLIYAPPLNMPLNSKNPNPKGIVFFTDHTTQNNPYIGQVNLARSSPSPSHINMPPLGQIGVSISNMVTNGDTTKNQLSIGSHDGGMHASNQPIGRSQLIGPGVITKAIRKNFGIQLKPLEGPIYRKSYPKWVDIMVPSLKGYKTPNCTTFFQEMMASIPWNMCDDLWPSVERQAKMNVISSSCFICTLQGLHLLGI